MTGVPRKSSASRHPPTFRARQRSPRAKDRSTRASPTPRADARTTRTNPRPPPPAAPAPRLAPPPTPSSTPTHLRARTRDDDDAATTPTRCGRSETTTGATAPRADHASTPPTRPPSSTAARPAHPRRCATSSGNSDTATGDNARTAPRTPARSHRPRPNAPTARRPPAKAWSAADQRAHARERSSALPSPIHIDHAAQTQKSDTKKSMRAPNSAILRRASSIRRHLARAANATHDRSTRLFRAASRHASSVPDSSTVHINAAANTKQERHPGLDSCGAAWSSICCTVSSAPHC